MRKLLDSLYNSAAALAALFMVGLLVMILLSIVSRQLHFNVPGIDAYAGYLMAGAGFLALAHTLKRGEHIRVTLILSNLGPTAKRWLERWAMGAGAVLAVLFAVFSVRLVVELARLQRYFHRQRRHGTVDSAARDGRRHGDPGDRFHRRVHPRMARPRRIATHRGPAP
jgi:TRAP-type C4-dicarboxylate transport system permease small subunit